ncbi:MAG TPA: phosphoribosylformylglycinamidine synthase [Candidatus Uhrbacteria bacterium]|nr:phosphoribosylformylglycinamidine synthase [Candidatus Uhrbacteria bacterium]
MAKLQRFYRQGVIRADQAQALEDQFDLLGLQTEACFNVETSSPLTPDELATLKWLLAETFEQEKFSPRSFLGQDNVVEVGPNNNFTTAWSTNACAICRACGITKVTRIEMSRRYFLPDGQEITPQFVAALYDRMTERPYSEPLKTFATDLRPEPVRTIPLIKQGIEALKEANKKYGLGMDEQDFAYYLDLFGSKLKRNPTDVELFQLAQANSEHSRHHFFKGQIIIDGRKMSRTLLELVMAPWKKMPGKSVIAFHDNSSAVAGYDCFTILPQSPDNPSAFSRQKLFYHIIFTAETHNFPSGVAPFPGAETGTGGRIRDIQAVGRGGLMIAGTVGFCVGGLWISGYDLPWEDKSLGLVPNLATPLQILLQESNGGFDYGNKIGEPVIIGFARSYDQRVADQRRAWFKPIMFTGGIGVMRQEHVKKNEPEAGEKVIILGGPNYRIGMGGGAASSMLQGDNTAGLDFDAVQRGDAEMQQKDLRVINACIAMGENNIIETIHDLGAGGNCNAIPEGVDPAGGLIKISALPLGDPTLSPREIWGNESQERYFITVKPENLPLFISICEREKCPYAVVGKITGDESIRLEDADGSMPVDLALKYLFGEVPQKKFSFTRQKQQLQPLKLPKGLTLGLALDRVLRDLSVADKGWAVHKVDNSVSGLIAQAQRVGPLQLALSDMAVVAQTHFGLTGAATAIGEKPILELLNPKAMARMATAESLTNLCWALISSWEEIRYSANWMWAAKVDDEGARLYDAAKALSEFLIKLAGPVIDGGKDSLSMAAKVPLADKTTEMVKAPGTLVMSAYAPMPDIRKKITPDLKRPGESKLMFIDLAKGNQRLGASTLAKVFKQAGNQCPDVEDADLLRQAFAAMQKLINRSLILAGHDRSDGGLITTLLEMAFSGNCGLDLDFRQKAGCDWLKYLFNEELGLVIEYLPKDERAIRGILRRHGLSGCCHVIGKTSADLEISLNNNTKQFFWAVMPTLRGVWQETSYQLEKLQANLVCIEQGKETCYERPGAFYELSFIPQPVWQKILKAKNKPKVAILREEGSNGDKEMAVSFYLAGFEPWDVTMSDIISARISMEMFRGIAFVGGFSFADVFDAGKGWAGSVRFNAKALVEFKNFYQRPDTFSLGVCNGCQVMALMGWVPWSGIELAKQPRFVRNFSGRFESRMPAVKIFDSPAIMLQGMTGSILPAIVAHGEGRFHAPDDQIFGQIIDQNLAPIRFVDDHGQETETYPFNPNGSLFGITALCDPTGRHLAFMEHPERMTLLWQWPYLPEDWQMLPASPWLKLFQNAYKWCAEQK